MTHLGFSSAASMTRSEASMTRTEKQMRALGGAHIDVLNLAELKSRVLLCHFLSFLMIALLAFYWDR